MRRRADGRVVAVVAGALCVLALIVGLAGPSRAAGPSGRGPTTPVYSYADAVRQEVWVEAPMDSDHDGRRDRIAVYLIRPGRRAARPPEGGRTRSASRRRSAG